MPSRFLLGRPNHNSILDHILHHHRHSHGLYRSSRTIPSSSCRSGNSHPSALCSWWEIHRNLGSSPIEQHLVLQKQRRPVGSWSYRLTRHCHLRMSLQYCRRMVCCTFPSLRVHFADLNHSNILGHIPLRRFHIQRIWKSSMLRTFLQSCRRRRMHRLQESGSFDCLRNRQDSKMRRQLCGRGHHDFEVFRIGIPADALLWQHTYWP